MTEKLSKREQIKNLEEQLDRLRRCIYVFDQISNRPFLTSMHDEATKLAIQIRELKQNDKTK